MSNLPEDIDRLLWTLAEHGDEKANEDFVKRFPQRRQELVQRTDAVKALKHAAPPADLEIPDFHLVPIKTQIPWKPISAVTALAAASILGLLLLRPVATSQPEAKMSAATQAESKLVFSDVDGMPQPQKHNLSQSEALRDDYGARTNQDIRREKAQNPPGMTIVRKLQMEGQPLSLVLKLLAEQANLKLEVYPGLDDQEVSVDYRNEAALLIYQDLGKRYGFDAFEDKPGQIVVVPQSRRNTATTPDPNGPLGFDPPTGDNNLSGPIGRR